MVRLSLRSSIAWHRYRGLALSATLLVLLACIVFMDYARRVPSDTVFVSIGAYRDAECGATLASLFSQAAHPHAVFAGAVAYVLASNATVGERCEAAELAPYEANIRRLVLNSSDARGPTLARFHAASLYGGQKYLLQIDSHINFTAGWDAELLRMAQTAPSRKAVFTHYPATRANMSETRVPVMCGADWLPEGVLTFKAALAEPPRRGAFRPVPFAAGGFMFAPAWVMKDVPYDPTLEFLFHGEEYLYSSRLWTSGWDLLTPDTNVAFHHYGRFGAPKYWEDFSSDASYHRKQRAVISKVTALMNGTYVDRSYPYGMGRARTLRQWWQYAGMDPANRSLVVDGHKFCWSNIFDYGPRGRGAGPPWWWGRWATPVITERAGM